MSTTLINGTTKPDDDKATSTAASNRRSTEVENGRNRRLFRSIELTLNPNSSSHHSERGTVRRSGDVKTTAAGASTQATAIEKGQSPVDNLIDSIRRLRFDTSITMRDLKSMVDRCLPTLLSDECVELSVCLIDAAVNDKNPDISFVVDLCTSLIVSPIFGAQMHDVLLKECIKMCDHRSEQLISTFVAELLVCQWPRHYRQAVLERNAILYAAVCIVKGWLNVIACADSNELEGARYARCLTNAFLVGKRRLWLNWPELVDEAYVVIERLLIGEGGCTLPSETRRSLLHLLFGMHEWTKRSIASVAVSTQTTNNR